MTWFVKGCAQRRGEFQITKVEKYHINCVGGGCMGSNVVQPMVDQLVRANPKIGRPGIKRTLKTAGFEITDRTSQRAKQRITKASREDEADAIARLPSWCEAIECDCPGPVATVETSPDDRYVRSFLMFGKAAYAAAHSVLKVVCMDADHLKGSRKGVMYILSMKDSNNHIIHVAIVLADKKNETNYRFLFEQTCRNERMKRVLSSGTATFFIDGHRGSPPALAKVLPDAPVRLCLRHIIANKSMRLMGAIHSAEVYKAAKMSSKALFDEAIKPIKDLFPSNYAFLTSYPIDKWRHYATFKHLAVQGSTTLNNAESTIALVGAETRRFDPLHLTMAIAEQTTEGLASHAELKQDSPDILVPFAAKFMEVQRQLSLSKYVKSQGLGVFLVQEHGRSMYGNSVKIEIPDAEGEVATSSAHYMQIRVDSGGESSAKLSALKRK